MTLRAHGVLWSLLVAAGCSPCALEQQVQGTVVDQDGEAVPGAVLRTCTGENCTVSQLDKPCTQTVSDVDGTFVLDVPRCEPVGGACELRPILVTAADCLNVTIQTTVDPGLMAIELVCEG